jgi:hypothetical protein
VRTRTVRRGEDMRESSKGGMREGGTREELGTRGNKEERERNEGGTREERGRNERETREEEGKQTSLESSILSSLSLKISSTRATTDPSDTLPSQQVCAEEHLEEGGKGRERKGWDSLKISCDRTPRYFWSRDKQNSLPQNIKIKIQKKKTHTYQ